MPSFRYVTAYNNKTYFRIITDNYVDHQKAVKPRRHTSSHLSISHQKYRKTPSTSTTTLGSGSLNPFTFWGQISTHNLCWSQIA